MTALATIIAYHYFIGGWLSSDFVFSFVPLRAAGSHRMVRTMRNRALPAIIFA